MNYLGHMYLSYPSEALMIGNFIADFVKGKQYANYPEEISKGIIMHRAVDEFTDNHPVVLQSKKRISHKYRHYSGVIIDMFYDHFLASNWSRYSDLSLEDFAAFTYKIMENNWHYLPGRSQYMLPYMKENNWLVNYAKTEGIHRSLTGMARRTKFESGMEEAVHDLKAFYNQFGAEFEVFIKDITDQFKIQN